MPAEEEIRSLRRSRPRCGDFAGRILPSDSNAARAYPVFLASRIVGGRPIAGAECQIAAITRSRGMALATRNLRNFEDTGIDVIDPWKSS